MSDYLTRLVARTLRTEVPVRPRLPSRFEPAGAPRGLPIAEDEDHGGATVPNSEGMGVSSQGAVSLQPDHARPAPDSRLAPVRREAIGRPPDESRGAGSGRSRDRDDAIHEAAPSRTLVDIPAGPATETASATKGDRAPSALVADRLPGEGTSPGSVLKVRGRAVAAPQGDRSSHSFGGTAAPEEHQGAAKSLQASGPTPTTRPAQAARPPPRPHEQGLTSAASIVPSFSTGETPEPSLHAARAPGIRQRDAHLYAAAAQLPRIRPARLPSGSEDRSPPVAETKSPEAETASTVKVTIGRVEVRAVTPERPPAPRARVWQGPSLTLEDYLRQRNRGER
jgi:hypothetical protein